MIATQVGVQTAARGPLPPGMLEYAQDKVARVAKFANRPVRFASVKVTVSENRAVERPFVAEAVMDIDGKVVWAHAAGHEGPETVDLLEQRLRRRVDEVEDRFEARTRLNGSMTAVLDRALDGVPRWHHRSLAAAAMTLEEACFDLEQLGQSFYLFTELLSGSDALVYRRADGTLGVRGVDVAPTEELVYEGAPPVLSEDDAVARLEASAEPFVFFIDDDARRGRVVYPCADGRVGVVTLD